MVQLVAGDILHSKADVIAHAIAPDEDFTTGLAKAIRQKWPALVKDFQAYRARHPLRPGNIWVWKTPYGRRIVSLVTHEVAVTQKKGRKAGKATSAYVDHALVALHALVRRSRAKSLAISRLATGSGGLAWGDVEPFIHEHFAELKIPVALYDRHRKGIKAKE